MPKSRARHAVACDTPRPRFAPRRCGLPGALSVIKTVEKIIPKSSGGTMEQQLGQLAGQTAAVTPKSAGASGSAAPAGSGWAPATQHSSSSVEAALGEFQRHAAELDPDAFKVAYESLLTTIQHDL